MVKVKKKAKAVDTGIRVEPVGRERTEQWRIVKGVKPKLYYFAGDDDEGPKWTLLPSRAVYFMGQATADARAELLLAPAQAEPAGARVLTVQEHANVLHALALYAADCSAGACDHFEHAEPMTPEQISDLMEDISGKGLAFQDGAPGRVDILVWREHGDDDDSLEVRAFAAKDAGTIQPLLEWEMENRFAFGDETPDGPGKAYTTGEQTINDGDILTSHDGRRFKVTIQEIAE